MDRNKTLNDLIILMEGSLKYLKRKDGDYPYKVDEFSFIEEEVSLIYEGLMNLKNINLNEV